MSNRFPEQQTIAECRGWHWLNNFHHILNCQHRGSKDPYLAVGASAELRTKAKEYNSSQLLTADMMVPCVILMRKVGFVKTLVID